MCNFFSCLVKKDGEILWHEATDSHNDLFEFYNEKDDGNIVPVEFTPPKDSTKICDFSKWNFREDIDLIPDWWNEAKENAFSKIKSIVSGMIVSDDRKILLGGCWVLVGKARVSKTIMARIVGMYDSSVVEGMCGSSVVEGMWGSSVVKRMCGSSVVEVMWGSSVVEGMWGSSVVKEMYDSSVVKRMWGSSVVKRMCDSSKIQTDKRSKDANL